MAGARCCWCREVLGRWELKQQGVLDPWVCPTTDCRQRQLAWAMVQRAKDKRTITPLFVPTPKQVEFFEMAQTTKYTLFGGAKAVAKSYALRWGAYRECARVPGLRVLLLRRTFGELEQSHLLDMPAEAERMKPMLGTVYTGGNREFHFGNDSLIKAGHCETDVDASKFLSSQWDLVIFDEIVTFLLDKMVLPIASCARTTKPQLIAEGGARVWAATNPGGRYAHWVKEWFVDREVDRERYPKYKAEQWGFVPGLVDDNPYMDPAYREQLENLPPLLRRQWLHGDWDAYEGMFFDFQKTHDITPDDKALLASGYTVGQRVPWHVQDMGIAA